MKNCYSEKHIINDTQLDFCNKLSIYEAIKLIQNATFNHSREMSLGHEDMLKNSNAFWVISKLKLKLGENLKAQDNVRVTTWTRPLSAIRALRDADIKIGNKVMVKALAEWCCLDYESKTIRKLNTIKYPDLEMSKNEYNNLSFSKFTEPDQLEEVYTKTVLASDIDINQHTNNLKYVVMSMDALTLEEFKNVNIDEFEIHFVNQSYFKDNIKIYKAINGKQILIFGKVEENIIFKVLILTK